MDILKDIIREIAVLIIFAGFLEMLLPQNELRKYLQLVVGLFVIVTIISPVANFFSSNQSIETAAWQLVPQDNTLSVINKGKEIAQIEQKNQAKNRDAHLAEQLKVITKLHPEVLDCQVELSKVDYGTNANETDNSGLEKRKVTLALKLQKNLSNSARADLIKRIREAIIAFFNFPAENIIINC